MGNLDYNSPKYPGLWFSATMYEIETDRVKTVTVDIKF